MGIESMRGNAGRSSSFLLGACIILSFVLICNWWFLSGQNNELITQINEIEDRMKTCCNAKEQCLVEHAKVKKIAEDINAEINKLKSDNDNNVKSKEEDLNKCKTETETIKQKLSKKDEEIKTHTAMIEQQKVDITKLQEQVKALTTQLESEKSKAASVPKAAEQDPAKIVSAGVNKT